MLYTIKNDLLHVVIASKGAELQSIIHTSYGIEYMWGGDTAYWGKKSPVLFPIVGTLKNNRFHYNGKEYELPRHGFARDMEFAVTEQADDSISFTIQSDATTVMAYPFFFRFTIQYSLQENSLHVKYIITNTGSDEMYFSVGAHPAFKVPLTDEYDFTDYYLEFEKTENAGRWPLAANGLIENSGVPYLKNTDTISLKKELFYTDALVFKNLSSQSIAIRTSKNEHGIKLSFNGFPYMGIWNAKDANFVCIEPWYGIADSVDATGKIEEKEGIQKIGDDETFSAAWFVTCF